MTAALLATGVLLGGGGLIAVVAGLWTGRSGTSAATPSRVPVRVRLRLTPRRRLLLLGGVVLGVVLWAVSGWIVYLVAVPLASLVLPALLADGSATDELARLDALESWTRSLSGLTISGASLEQTIAASRPGANQALMGPLSTLVARLNARWRTDDALRAFADDLNDPTCDLVVMHLLLAERMRGPGLARALEDLATSIAEEVRSRRAIETDRAKPRQNVRIITATTLLLLVAMPFAGTFMLPYHSVAGQALLAGWLLAYAGVLVWLRRLTATRPPARLLGERAA